MGVILINVLVQFVASQQIFSGMFVQSCFVYQTVYHGRCSSALSLLEDIDFINCLHTKCIFTCIRNLISVCEMQVYLHTQ